MSLHDDACRVLAGWQAPDADQESRRRLFLAHLAEHADGVYRSCRPDHLTASALVLDHTGTRALLTHHAKLGVWCQLGGHCEPDDATLAGAALREATEESGIDGLRLLPSHPQPVDLDRHALPASSPCGHHLDVRYVLIAPPGAVEVASAESLALRWLPLAELVAAADGAAGPVPADVARFAARAAGYAVSPSAPASSNPGSG